MKKIWITLITGTIAALFVQPSPAVAAPSGGDNSAICTLAFVERASPGFTLTPSSGNQDSAINAGSIDCVGKIDGHKVTGPGTFWNQGRYMNSTCLLDHAEGRYFTTLPTEAGPISAEGTFVVDRVGPVLKVRVEQPEVRGEGSALVIPMKGNCVVNPITEVFVLMSVTFRDAESAAVERQCGLDIGVVLINCATRSAVRHDR